MICKTANTEILNTRILIELLSKFQPEPAVSCASKFSFLSYVIYIRFLVNNNTEGFRRTFQPLSFIINYSQTINMAGAFSQTRRYLDQITKTRQTRSWSQGRISETPKRLTYFILIFNFVVIAFTKCFKKTNTKVC